MYKKPKVEDFERKIRIVFFNKTNDDLKSIKEFFSDKYFEITGERTFDKFSNCVFSDMPDLIVCTDNFRVLINNVEKYIYYIKYNDFFEFSKELSDNIKKQAEQNYLDKIKYYIKLAIGKKENPNRNEVVKKIVNMLELKDKYLKDHSVRVAMYAELIGKKLNLEETKLEKLKHIALLHDIGKLAIPSVIINKPGELTKEETRIYEYHTLMGRYVLDFPYFDGMRKAILYHHERMDGLGYFKKKTEEEIPLYARIVCIVNAFDVLTTTRFYGKRLNYDEAKKVFLKYTKKTQKMPFDYRIVKIFLKCLEDVNFIDINQQLDNLLKNRISIELEETNC